MMGVGERAMSATTWRRDVGVLAVWQSPRSPWAWPRLL